MDNFDLVIVNGLVITASDTAKYDIAIKDGKIAVLAPRGFLKSATAKRTIDAQGGYVMPGGVDCHVHLQEPPLFGGRGRSSDNFETGIATPTLASASTIVSAFSPASYNGYSAHNSRPGTRSAICGGTTTIVAFAPQAKTVPDLLSVLDETMEKAEGNCYTDYSFHMIIGNPSPQALSDFPTLRQRGISSLKIFLTYEALQLRDDQVLDVLYTSRQHGMTTMIHAENGDVLNWMTRKLEERGLVAPKYHATSRPQLVETEATYRAIALSELADAPILIVHVSSPGAAAHLRAAQTRGLPVYAETCPQYLFLTRADLEGCGHDHEHEHADSKGGNDQGDDRSWFEGAKSLCAPPPRDSPSDLSAIWLGLQNGTFTILSSDHCPFKYADDDKGKTSVFTDYPDGRFSKIPNGVPGVETRLSLVLSENRLSLNRFVELTSTNPARLYGMYPVKGALVPGISDADLVVWYPPHYSSPESRSDAECGPPMEPVVLKNSMLHHNVDYSPYEGRTLTQWPRYTILRGEVVWDRENGGLVGKKGHGQFIKRDKSSLPGPRLQGEWDVSAF